LSDQSVSDRIFVEKKTMEIFKCLNASATKNSSITDQPFSEAKEVFMWAVSIGVRDNKRLPLSGAKDQLFFWNRLSQDKELMILQLVAIAETKDINILKNERYVQELAEEYANYGIRIINETLLKQGGPPLFNLVDLIRTYSTSNTD